MTKPVTVSVSGVGRPKLHDTPAQRTAAWRQRQRLATIGIHQPDPDLTAENTRLRGEIERLLIELAAAKATIHRQTRAQSRPPTPPPAPQPRPPVVSASPTPPSAAAGQSAPVVLNRAQRRQAEREQRRHP